MSRLEVLPIVDVMTLLKMISLVDFFLGTRHDTKDMVPIFSYNLHDKPMGRVSINWNAFGCNEQLKTRKFITLRSVEMVYYRSL